MRLRSPKAQKCRPGNLLYPGEYNLAVVTDAPSPFPNLKLLVRLLHHQDVIVDQFAERYGQTGKRHDIGAHAEQPERDEREQ